MRYNRIFKMFESNSTNVEEDNGSLHYYEELGKRINSFSEKFPQKSVIRQDV